MLFGRLLLNLDSPSKKVKTSLILRNQGDRVVLAQQNYHQRGVTIMAQDFLPFKYEKEKKNTGMTALAGLPVYLDLA